MTLRLAALLPHGNKRCSESSRHLIRRCPYTATGNAHICKPALSNVSEGLRDKHCGVRESHATLSNVFESLRDRRWSASCSLALRYKFTKLLQGKPE